MVSPRRLTACWEKEIKTYLAPTPFFLDSFVYCIFWVHHSKFSSVKILLFIFEQPYGTWDFFFPCGSYISLYIISVLQKFDCQLHVG